jgi:hypothetical protein
MRFSSREMTTRSMSSPGSSGSGTRSMVAAR